MSRKNLELREVISEGYRVGMPIKDIAELGGSTIGSVKVIAHGVGLKHPRAGKGNLKRHDKFGNPLAYPYGGVGP